MSLATRCSNCGTIFRVVQDQLLVSEGWVRCGRCREVFNALEHMFDLKKDVPSSPLNTARDRSGPSSERRPLTGPISTSGGLGQGHDSGPASDFGFSSTQTHGFERSSGRGERDERHDPWSGTPTDQLVHSSLWPESHQPSQSGDSEYMVSTTQVDVALDGADHDDKHEPSDLDDIHRADTRDEWPTSELPAAPHVGVDESHLDDVLASGARDTTFVPFVPEPGFMQRANEASRWQQPRVRLALRLSAWLLSIGLVGQLIFHHRDTLAARWPALEPVLSAVCAPLDCRVDMPRKLNALRVASVALNETDTAGVYRLALSVLNEGDTPVRTPSIDLQLTDARGQTQVRRVLSATELGARASAIEVATEMPMQALLRVQGPPFVGYNVVLFYP
jgi:predicted Zn finger-like uncharacterized protein